VCGYFIRIEIHWLSFSSPKQKLIDRRQSHIVFNSTHSLVRFLHNSIFISLWLKSINSCRSDQRSLRCCSTQFESLRLRSMLAQHEHSRYMEFRLKSRSTQNSITFQFTFFPLLLLCFMSLMLILRARENEFNVKIVSSKQRRIEFGFWGEKMVVEIFYFWKKNETLWMCGIFCFHHEIRIVSS
jgi:hypothetical protein